MLDTMLLFLGILLQFIITAIGSDCSVGQYKNSRGSCKSCKLLCNPAYSTTVECREKCPGMFSIISFNAHIKVL